MTTMCLCVCLGCEQDQVTKEKDELLPGESLCGGPPGARRLSACRYIRVLRQGCVGAGRVHV